MEVLWSGTRNNDRAENEGCSKVDGIKLGAHIALLCFDAVKGRCGFEECVV
jgi:hypothetical protein